MVPEQNDHVVVDGKPLGPQKFTTSDQCTGCHNATATLSPARLDFAETAVLHAPAIRRFLAANGECLSEWRMAFFNDGFGRPGSDFFLAA